MVWTAVMIVILVGSYGLMFGLVKFTENVIAPSVPAPRSTADRGGDIERSQ